MDAKERQQAPRRSPDQSFTYLAQDLWISQNHASVFSTSQCDVESTRIVQETDSLVVVASDTAEDDVVLLSSLERIDAGHLDVLVKLLLERAVKLHVCGDVGPLPFVRCDDTNLTR